MTKSNNELFLYALKVVQEAEADQEKNPTSDFIQVVVVEPSKEPYKRTIPNTLEAMQAIVGGYYQHITIDNTETGASIGVVVNEEGKLHNLPYNRRILSYRGVIDILVGTFFITALNLAGEHVSLSDAQAAQYIKRFRSTEVYI